MKKIFNRQDKWVAVACESKKDGKFEIPIYDTRRDDDKANEALKAANATKGSRFMRPTFAQGGGSYQAPARNRY
jgi:hypothetical protein